MVSTVLKKDLEVGLKIKRYLNMNGISQAFLSRKTDIKIFKISSSLNGNRRLTFDEYAEICKALKLNIDYFLESRQLNHES